MADLVMRTAVGNYGHTKGLKDGSAKSDRFDMEHIEVSPITSVFRRMVRELEFDVSRWPSRPTCAPVPTGRNLPVSPSS